MKFVDEFRDPQNIARLAIAIAQQVTRPWTIMEVCGGQTHAILKHGVDQLLPSSITLIHGPGCPVCVTPMEAIDKAIEIAALSEVIFCSFGDMLRIPGSQKDLLTVKAEGGDVRAVYSPLDVLTIAQENPNKQIVFFAVGFETTAPTTAMTVYRAKQLGLKNVSMLVSHVRVPPAMEAILSAPNNQVQGFLAAGHVSTIMGYREYEDMARQYRVPIVVTGFEPLDILQGLFHCIGQMEAGTCGVENQYPRVVTRKGNSLAQDMMNRVYKIVSCNWRGFGEIKDGGFALRSEYQDFDAEQKFDTKSIVVAESELCRSAKVLQGLIKPTQCPAFATTCTPENPLGATMVSSEGACAAYYRYRRLELSKVQSA